MTESVIEDAATPLRKRKRTSDIDGKEQVITRLPEFWFADGSIILHVEDTQFRVHKGTLARHSRVFDDMFKLPQPEDETLIEGCQIIHLSDKSLDRVRLLTAIYDFPKVLECGQRMPLCIIVSMLRLGKKYEFPTFWGDAADRLRRHFPAELSEWDNRNDFPMISGTIQPIIAINIAVETGLKSILPSLYMSSVCRKDFPECIFNGNGSTGTSRSTSQSIIRGYSNAIEAVRSHKLERLSRFTPSCDEKRVCRVVMSQIMAEILRTPFSTFLNLNPWTQMKQSLGSGLCYQCDGLVGGLYEDGRRKLWESLPSCFGLAAWEDLKDFKIDTE